jgi:hypothetical protein
MLSNMTTDWVQFALKLAENARAGVAEERKQLELIRAKQDVLPEQQPVLSAK